MADQKITQLAEQTVPVSSDIVPIVHDPSGSPVTQKTTIDNFLSKLSYRQVHQIYCLGDSLTWNGTIETKLETLLGSYWRTINYGIPANTTTLQLARFYQDIMANRDIEYLVIWAGIVDVINGVAAATIEANLQAMYTAAHNAGIKVIAVNIAPNTGLAAGKQAVLDAVNAWIAATASDIDYKVDVYSLLEDPGAPDSLLAAYDSGDGLHLSTAGYNVVGQAIYDNSTFTMSIKGYPYDFIRGDGWRTITETVTYVSVDDPTGVVDFAGDVRTKYTVGMRLKFYTLTSLVKGIITNVNQTLQAGNTRISFLHEIDPTDSLALALMQNDKITAPFYSTEKAPLGFDPDKRKWSIRVVDTADRTQSAPVSGTYYNLGTQSITLPIGAWSLSATVQLGAIAAASGAVEAFVALSTSNSSISDAELEKRGMVNAGVQLGHSIDIHKDIVVATKTPYYLISKMTYGSGAGSTLANWNATQNLVMLAVCNYL